MSKNDGRYSSQHGEVLHLMMHGICRGWLTDQATPLNDIGRAQVGPASSALSRYALATAAAAVIAIAASAFGSIGHDKGAPEPAHFAERTAARTSVSLFAPTRRALHLPSGPEGSAAYP